jgi:hypothetical protein
MSRLSEHRGYLLHLEAFGNSGVTVYADYWALRLSDWSCKLGTPLTLCRVCLVATEPWTTSPSLLRTRPEPKLLSRYLVVSVRLAKRRSSLGPPRFGRIRLGPPYRVREIAKLPIYVLSNPLGVLVARRSGSWHWQVGRLRSCEGDVVAALACKMTRLAKRIRRKIRKPTYQERRRRALVCTCGLTRALCRVACARGAMSWLRGLQQIDVSKENEEKGKK